MRKLRPSVASAFVDRTPISGDDVEAAELFGRRAWLWALEMGERVAMNLVTSYPAFGVGGLPMASLRDGVVSGAVRVLLSVGTDEQRGMMTPENMLCSQEFVRLEIPLSVVLAAVRRGATWFLQAFLDEVDRYADPLDRSNQMRRVVPLVLLAFEDFTADLQNRYLVEHARWVTGVSAARREFIQQILAGQEIDVVAAGATLDYPLHGNHTAAVLTCSEDGTDADLQRLGMDLVRALRGQDSIFLPAGTRELWLWCTDARDDPSSVAALRISDGVRVAVGRGNDGLTGFRLTHAQAVETLRIATLAGSPLTFYREIELLALVTCNTELSRRFVLDTLGDLADATPDNRELWATVEAYLRLNHSLIHAADALHVNRNTVSYRIAKAERLLGFSVRSHTQELLAALAVAKLAARGR